MILNGNSPWIAFYEQDIIHITLVASENDIYHSVCHYAFLYDYIKCCKFIGIKYKRILIYCIAKLIIIEYEIYKCITHKINNIDIYFPLNEYSILHVKNNELKNYIDFFQFKTSKTQTKSASTRLTEFTFKFIQYVWSIIWKGIISFLLIYFLLISFLLFCFLLQVVDI